MNMRLKKGRPPLLLWQRILLIALGILIAISLFIGISAWLAQRNEMDEQGRLNSTDTVSPENRQHAEGRDESAVSASSLDAYKVSPDVPRILTIDKLSIKARILPMETNPDNSMQAPLNIFDSGWYTSSAKPGEPGAVAIDGHASGPTREGLFAYLDTLAIGDKIKLERGDGKVITYEVTHTETVALDAIDMKKFLKTHNGVEKGLNLMTCTGEWLRGKNTFDHRVIVYTKQVS